MKSCGFYALTFQLSTDISKSNNFRFGTLTAIVYTHCYALAFCLSLLLVISRFARIKNKERKIFN